MADRSDSYRLTVRNNSNNFGSIMIYQQHPDIKDPNIKTLAWLVKAAYPGTTVDFYWTEEYNFFWSEFDSVQDTATFRASQTYPADPDDGDRNRVQLVYRNHAFSFRPPTGQGADGKLLIEMDGSIPADRAMVGIGMSQRPIFMLPAQPNLQLLLKPNTQYWITGGWFQEGEVVEVEALTKSHQLEFPGNRRSLVMELNKRNEWNLLPGLD